MGSDKSEGSDLSIHIHLFVPEAFGVKNANWDSSLYHLLHNQEA